MKRRDFFKGIFGATAAVAISPLILPGLLSKPKETGEVLVSDAKGKMSWAEPANDTVSTESSKLTDSLFGYLDSHKKDLKFRYKRIALPAGIAYYIDRSNKNFFQVKSESLLVQSRKLRCRYCPELANDLHAYGRDLHQEFEDERNSVIVEELNHVYPKSVLYIYQLVPTAVIFNPEDFTPRRGLILRLARIDDDREWVL